MRKAGGRIDAVSTPPPSLGWLYLPLGSLAPGKSLFIDSLILFFLPSFLRLASGGNFFFLFADNESGEAEREGNNIRGARFAAMNVCVLGGGGGGGG